MKGRIAVSGSAAVLLAIAATAAAQFVQQGVKLTGQGEVGSGAFGSGVALTADGNTALIGGSRDNGGMGAAWVFTRSGNAWTQQGSKLVGGGETGVGAFGYQVAVSGDGNTALISGPADSNNGAVWVFTRSGTTWSQQGPKLQVIGPPPTTEPGEFGSSVALSQDGNTALIGGMSPNGVMAEAWVFVRSGGNWSQQGPVLTASGAGADYSAFSSVALSADGNTAVLGAPATVRRQGIVSYGYSGAAWVFTRSGSAWSQQAELTPGGPIGDTEFGASVALSGDGNTALIGAPDPLSAIAGGSAWIFTRSSGAWAQQGSALTGAGEGAQGHFGQSAALSGDGNTALVGGPNNNGGTGLAWQFVQSAGSWTQNGTSLAGGGESGSGAFGSGVTLSSDGSTALIGGPGDSSQGAAWPFVTAHTVSVTLTGAGSGLVTGNGISCPSTCSQSYPSGTLVTLAATANPGSAFGGWSGADCSGTGTCTVTMSADQDLTAAFVSSSTLAGCGIKPTSNRVLLFHHRLATKTRVRPGTVSLHVLCNQGARVTLTGRLIETLGKKHGPGKHPTKSFTLHLTQATVAAGITKTMTVSLPPAALNGLKHHATESVSFTLTITNANGTSHAMAKISSLKPA